VRETTEETVWISIRFDSASFVPLPLPKKTQIFPRIPIKVGQFNLFSEISNEIVNVLNIKIIPSAISASGTGSSLLDGIKHGKME
jgi:hypothetical protein